MWWSFSEMESMPWCSKKRSMMKGSIWDQCNSNTSIHDVNEEGSNGGHRTGVILDIHWKEFHQNRHGVDRDNGVSQQGYFKLQFKQYGLSNRPANSGCIGERTCYPVGCHSVWWTENTPAGCSNPGSFLSVWRSSPKAVGWSTCELPRSLRYTAAHSRASAQPAGGWKRILVR